MHRQTQICFCSNLYATSSSSIVKFHMGLIVFNYGDGGGSGGGSGGDDDDKW